MVLDCKNSNDLITIFKNFPEIEKFCLKSNFLSNDELTKQLESNRILFNTSNTMLSSANQINLNESISNVFSLASLFNSRSLEQNSQILLSLTRSKESCMVMRQSNCINVLIRIIYDEWIELYDFFEIYKNSKEIELVKTTELAEIINRRINSRKTSVKAIQNLILNTISLESSKTGENLKLIFKSRKEAKIFDTIMIITNFNDIFFDLIFKKITSENTVYFYDLLKLNELRASINDLVKRSFDDDQRNILAEFGAANVISELLEILWYFIDYFNDDSNDLLIDSINKITIEAIKILNNVTFLNLDLKKIVCSRRLLLSSLFNCLLKCKNGMSKFDKNMTSDLIILICLLIRNLNTNEKMEKKFIAEITEIAIIYASEIHSQISQTTLIALLKTLIEICANSMENKAVICNLNKSFSCLIMLIRLNDYKYECIIELSITLMRSILNYCMMNESCRIELRSLNFYQVVLESSLTSSNLNIVANACGILWSISRCKSEQRLLWTLGADVKLKGLCNSSHKIISMTAKAALKNLYSSTENHSNNNSSSISPSTSCSNSPLPVSTYNTNSVFSNKNFNLINSSNSLNSSISSSLSTNSILSNRNRKQLTENSIEFFNKINKCSLPNEFGSLNFDDFPSNSSSSIISSSSFSSTESSSSISTSNSDFSSSSDSLCSNNSKKGSYYLNRNNKPYINNNSYYLNELKITLDTEDLGQNQAISSNLQNECSNNQKSIIKSIQNNNKPIKHVTFSSRDNIYFNYDPSGPHIRFKEVDKKIESEIVIDAKSLIKKIDTNLVLNSTFKPSSQALKYNLKKDFLSNSARPNSPVTNYRFIKSNSSLMLSLSNVEDIKSNPSITSPQTNDSNEIIELTKKLNIFSIKEPLNSGTIQKEWSSLLNIKKITKFKHESKPKRLVGLVKPFTPALNLKNEYYSNFKDKNLNQRIQEGVLIKKNSFIIEDQEKKSRKEILN